MINPIVTTIPIKEATIRPKNTNAVNRRQRKNHMAPN